MRRVLLVSFVGSEVLPLSAQLPDLSCQFSFVSCQFSFVSCQFSVFSFSDARSLPWSRQLQAEVLCLHQADCIHIDDQASACDGIRFGEGKHAMQRINKDLALLRLKNEMKAIDSL